MRASSPALTPEAGPRKTIVTRQSSPSRLAADPRRGDLHVALDIFVTDAYYVAIDYVFTERTHASCTTADRTERLTLAELDRHSSDALVATDPMTGDIVGVGRFAALPDKEGAVDVAVTVGDPWQGRGLGTALLARLIERARDEGHLAVHASVLAENAASIAMLRRAGFASRSGAGAMREFELAFTETRGRENP